MSLQLHDPHAYLGAHYWDGGVVVRAYRPEATRIVVRPEEGAPVELLPAGDGLFEGVVEGADLPLRYELEVAYPDGNTFTQRDAYAFPPTLGELDTYLVGEGRHEQLYERLGAHVREVEGVVGTSFAVWAPSARSVSVVGDFNSWDGRLNPMRSLGPSGVWELFVPDVEEGARYKFEIRTQLGELRVKADPLAFHQESPPQTNSIVHRPTYAFEDDAWMEARRTARPADRADLHLRGAPRLVAARPRQPGPRALVPRRSPTSSATTSRTWASRTSSCCP